MIADNIKFLRDKIAEKCIKVNRNPGEIKIIAVSKNFGVKEIIEATKEGIFEFGENKAQELDKKFSVLGNKVSWHFIGHLQKNKVKFAVNYADYIHSVDSKEIASEINKRAEKFNKIQKILLEVKTSDEETKVGISNEGELIDTAGYCKELKNIELIGLMTIAPFTTDKKLIRKSFQYLGNLNNSLCLNELSMGMTDDFEIAIEEGATMLRIGTGIFGVRDYTIKTDEL
jgi:PLP dependent protein